MRNNGSDEAVFETDEFIKDKSITTLNVAGPRASGEARAYNYARALIKEVILNCSN